MRQYLVSVFLKCPETFENRGKRRDLEKTMEKAVEEGIEKYGLRGVRGFKYTTPVPRGNPKEFRVVFLIHQKFVVDGVDEEDALENAMIQLYLENPTLVTPEESPWESELKVIASCGADESPFNLFMVNGKVDPCRIPDDYPECFKAQFKKR